MKTRMKTSAGLLMYRVMPGCLDVLLAHPGGPYFRNKDDGWWTLPKGEPNEGEEPSACARREFREETGIDADGVQLVSLGEVRQRGGKQVLAWAFDGAGHELDCQQPPPSSTFELEWPPRSGKRVCFPEVDRIAWFTLEEARRKILPAQAELLTRLADVLGKF
jgi:predicted NUDIX family NTP pyrophosphohydrolase